MKATEILNQIKDVLGLELSEEKVALATMKLDNGTEIEAEEFVADKEVFIVGEEGETLPLYGKEVRGRRDRYHYYTTTGGENLYPIPVSHDGRDCVDDIGCQELYGNETVTVTGKTDSFNVNMYRTDDFF